VIGRLFRSGWWVAVAAVISVGAILGWVVRPGPVTQRGDGHDPATYGFDLSCLNVSKVVAGGMGRDGLHAIDNPETIPGAQVATINKEHRGKLLVGTDRIIGVSFQGLARAYPLRLMRWHEVVNDTLGGEEIVVTYSGLCDASAVWRRPVNDSGSMVFGVSGLLVNSNTLIYDRGDGLRESTLWSQLGGHAIAGPLACSQSRLEGVPFELASWSDWLERHPDTDVMAPLAQFKRLYKRDPYHSYFGSQVLHFPVDPMPPAEGPEPKERVVIVDTGDHQKVFAISGLAARVGENQGVVTDTVGDIPVKIHFTIEPPTARVEVLDAGREAPVMRIAFWFAWHAQFPNQALNS